MNKKKARLCMDCKVDTVAIGEYYFIETNVWLSVVHSKKGMLCISCLEKRLKRRLTRKDFTPCYINFGKIVGKSKQLQERLKA